MVRTQGLLITRQCTPVQGLSLLQLALVADEVGQIVDCAEGVRVVRTQSHLITCQCTSVQGLSLLQLALVADENDQIVPDIGHNNFDEQCCDAILPLCGACNVFRD